MCWEVTSAGHPLEALQHASGSQGYQNRRQQYAQGDGRTGALIAVVLGLKKRYAGPAIALGVLLAAVLVTLASTGVLKGLEWMAR